MANLFSDPVLRARQDQLNAQWAALYRVADNCQLDPVSAAGLQQFFADYHSWKEFYASESDFTKGSKQTTDSWQAKLQEYTRTIGSQLCGQTRTGQNTYVPDVDDPPPDDPGLFDGLRDVAKDFSPFKSLTDWVTRVGIGVLIAIALILGAVVIFLTHGKASGFGVKVG